VSIANIQNEKTDNIVGDFLNLFYAVPHTPAAVRPVFLFGLFGENDFEYNARDFSENYSRTNRSKD